MNTNKRDELVKDLATIITDSHDENAVLNSKLLMEKLVSYIVRRDHRVFDHAYKVGHKAGKGMYDLGDSK